MIPLSIGLALGGIFAGTLLSTVPVFARPGPFPLVILGAGHLFMALLVWACIFVTLVFVGMYSKSGPPSADVSRAGILGFSLLPVIVTIELLLYGSQALFHSRFVIQGLSVVLAVIVVLLIIASPACLVRWPHAGRKLPTITRQLLRSAGWTFAIGAILVCLMLAFRAYAFRRMDEQCQQLAAWVKTTYPTAGAYPDVKLPGPFSRLSSNGTVDIVVLPDGREVLMFTTFPGGHTATEFYIYSTSPITTQ